MSGYKLLTGNVASPDTLCLIPAILTFSQTHPVPPDNRNDEITHLQDGLLSLENVYRYQTGIL